MNRLRLQLHGLFPQTAIRQLLQRGRDALHYETRRTLRGLDLQGAVERTDVLACLRSIAGTLRIQARTRVAILSSSEWLYLARSIGFFEGFGPQASFKQQYTEPVLEYLCSLSSTPSRMTLADLERWQPTRTQYAYFIDLWCLAEAILDNGRQAANLSLCESFHLSNGQLQVAEPDLIRGDESFHATRRGLHPVCVHGLAPVTDFLDGSSRASFLTVAIASSGVQGEDARFRLLNTYGVAPRYSLSIAHGDDLFALVGQLKPPFRICRPKSTVLATSWAAGRLMGPDSHATRMLIDLGSFWYTHRQMSMLASQLREHTEALRAAVAPVELELPSTDDDMVRDLTEASCTPFEMAQLPAARVGADYVGIDMVSITQQVQSEVVVLPDSQTVTDVRSKLFEAQVRTLVAAAGRAPKDIDTIVKTLRLGGRAITDIDACVEWGDDLLLVSCKSIIMRLPTLALAFREVRNASERVRQYATEWCETVTTLRTNRVGDNYDLSRFKEIYGVVCVPFAVQVLGTRLELPTEGLLRSPVSVSDFWEWLGSAEPPPKSEHAGG